MIERKALSVSQTPEMHAFAGEPVAAGGYDAVCAVMRSGLRLLRHEEAARTQRTPRDRSVPGDRSVRQARARGGRDARG